MRLKIRRPFCLGLKVLTGNHPVEAVFMKKNAMQNWLTPMHVPMYILIVYTPVMTVILKLKCLFGSKILATYMYMVTLNAFPLHRYMTQNTFFLHILIRSIAVERIIFHCNSTDSLGHRAYALDTYLMVALLWRGSYFKQSFSIDEFIQPGVSATNAIVTGSNLYDQVRFHRGLDVYFLWFSIEVILVKSPTF